MKHMHQGLDYRLYKVYAWGGLLLIVVYIAASTLLFDALSLPGPQVFLLLAGPLLLWFAGILLYWWWVFLFKGNRELAELGQAQGQEVPGIEALRSWNTLHQAMAIHGGSVEELIKNTKRANRPILLWYGVVNLLAVWILCPIVLGSLEVINPDWGTGLWVWLAGIFAGVALLLVATPILAGWSGKSAQQAELAPLGLALASSPRLEADRLVPMGEGQKLIPEDAAVVEGERFGRLVHIERVDEHSLTVVQARVPEFTVQSNEGKLVSNEEAPEAVSRALQRLRKAKRWQGIAVYSGPEGMGIQRQSKGTNMWLYDLWLAEYLLDEINAVKEAAPL